MTRPEAMVAAGLHFRNQAMLGAVRFGEPTSTNSTARSRLSAGLVREAEREWARLLRAETSTPVSRRLPTCWLIYIDSCRLSQAKARG